MYELYSVLWILSYIVAIIVPFFVLGSTQRYGQVKKTCFIIFTILALVYIIFGHPIYALIFSSLGFFTGRFLNIEKNIIRLSLLIGWVVTLCNTFWPTRLVFFSPLTATRPTILRLFISMFDEGKPNHDWTQYSQYQGKVAIFGKYIAAGLPAAVGEPRVEIQIILSLAIFFVTFLIIFGIMKLIHRGTKRIALLFSGTILYLLVLPVPGVPALLTIILNIFIGVFAYRTDLFPYFLRSISFSSSLVVVAVYIILYHLCYAEGLIEGYGFGGVSIRSTWAIILTGIGIFSILLGPVLVQSRSMESQ